MILDRWDAFMFGLATAEALNGRSAEAIIFLACGAAGVFINWRERSHLARFDRTRPHGAKDG